MRQAFLLLAILFALLGCSQQGTEAALSPGVRDATIQLPQQPDSIVFVSVLPQKYFVDRISGGRWQVEVMVPPSASPATYSPTPRQMTRLASASAYFRIGVPFEQAILPQIARQFPSLPIVDTRKDITLRHIESIEELEHHDDEHEEHHDAEHEHGDHEDHHHHAGQLDPHIWLSPSLAKLQARNVYKQLAKLDPDYGTVYWKNLQDFNADAEALHDEIAATLAPLRNRSLLVFHPSWGYFCDEFGLRQVAIETGGKSPVASPLAQVIDYAQDHDIHVVFVQQQFSTAEAKAVAQAIDGRVVSLDPLAGDWLANLRHIATTLAAGDTAE